MYSAPLSSFHPPFHLSFLYLSSTSSIPSTPLSVLLLQMYGRDLIEELDKVLGGTFQRIVMAAMRDNVERDAHILYKAMKGVGCVKVHTGLPT